MSRSKAVFVGGGIVGLDAEIPEGAIADSVHARAYTHDALGDRVVVRLAAHALAPGVDLEMKTLGFGAGEDRGTVGKQRRRALGFPGWALVNDPEHAQYALEVVDSLAKEARRAKSKPGHAKKGIDTIAETLGRSVPHFLPSFYEEAGRIFIDAGNLGYAAQAFEAAREAERVHGLTIDEELRRESFLEFALAGAVSIKSLSAYAKDLERARSPEEAYKQFRQLAVQRTLGGMPPWASMAKDLRRLAKAAKLDPEAEDEALLLDLIGSPSLKRAAREMWSTYRKPLARIAKSRPEVRGFLLDLFPQPGAALDGFYDEWLSLLDECGALDALRETDGSTPEAARARDGAAAWLGKWVRHATSSWRAASLGVATFELLESMAPRLVKDGAPVALVTRWGRTIDLDMLELALSLGVPVADFDPAMHVFDLAEWSRHASEPGHGRDPVHVAADARFRQGLVNGVGVTAGDADFEKVARGKAGLHEIRRAWLRERVGALGSGGLLHAEQMIEELSQKTSKETFVEFPDAYELLEQQELWPTLARTLSNGIMDELGWPALDQALGRHWPDRRVVPSAFGVFPYLCLSDGAKVVVIGPEKEELVHDLVLPKGALIHAIRYAQGELFVVFRESSTSWTMLAYWSRDPRETFPVGHSYSFQPRCDRGVVLADGSVSTGGRALSAGDRELPLDQHHAIVFDGTTMWQPEWTREGQRLRERDPRTGDLGRYSMPAFFEAFVQDGSVLALWESRLSPLPAGVSDSPLGAEDGMTGWRVRTRNFNDPRGASRPIRELERIDGPRFEGFVGGSVSPFALLSMPGDARARPVSATTYRYQDGAMILWDADGKSACTKLGAATPYTAGSRVPLEVGWWHLFRPRDPEASKALRAMSSEAIDPIAQAAKEDHAVGATDGRLPSALSEALPAVREPHIVRAITALARHAAELDQKLASLRDQRNPSGGRALDRALPTDDELQQALGAFHQQVGYDRGSSTVADLRAIDALAAKLGGADSHVSQQSSPVRWERFVGSARFFAFLGSRFSTAEDDRQHLASLLSFWAESAIARPAGSLRYFRATYDDVGDRAPAWIVGLRERKAQLATIVGHAYWMRSPDPWNVKTPIEVIEIAPEGEAFRVPLALHETESRLIGSEVDSAFAERFSALLPERGPAPHDPTAVEALATAIARPPEVAALLLAGLPNLNSYQKNFLSKEVRETLGIKVSEADAARKVLRELSLDDVVRVIARAVPDDPALLWSPLEGGEGSFVARLARAWNERFGQPKAVVDGGLTALVDKELRLGAVLGLFASPDDRQLTVDSGAVVFDEWGRPESVPKGFSEATLQAVVPLAAWLAAYRPAGDPLRAAIPTVIERARARARHSDFALAIGSTYFYGGDASAKTAALLEQVGGEATSDGRDAGLFLAHTYGYDGNGVRVDLRPSRIEGEDDWRRAEQLSAILAGAADSASWRAQMQRGLTAARALFSADFDALAARIASTPVPEGAFEVDPSKSHAELVATVQRALDLDQDAAVLYLQTLALPSSKRADVLAWNGWTAARYKKAAQALVARELVVEAKRARAGRDIFLPGGWESLKAPHMPIESWKVALYGVYRDPEGRLFPPLGVYVPLEPVHQLFQRAWARVEAGDAPRYEEVS